MAVSSSFKVAALLLLALASVQAVIPSARRVLKELPDNFEELFQEWRREFNRQYPTLEEEAYRLSVFIDNLQVAVEHNKREYVTFSKGLNQFSDLTHEEFASKFLHKIVQSDDETARFLRRRLSEQKPRRVRSGANDDLPYYVNWDQRGIVTRPRNQGSDCQAGYAFATIAHLESIQALENGVRSFLSEQQILDCSSQFGNKGCKGGQADFALNFSTQANIVSAFEYPYVGKDQPCNVSQTAGSAIEDYKQLPLGDCSNLQQQLVKGTVVAGVDATEWKDYTGGVLPSGGVVPNHYVLVVGYLENSDMEGYWIVKNSWGVTWGEEGFARLELGDNSGLCDNAFYGVTTSP